MKVLLHICCGPCSIMPIQRLQEEGHEVTGYFYNPNIHPLAEYMRRREGAAQVAARYKIKMLWASRPEDYNTAAWLRMVHGNEDAPHRCRMCWEDRLEATFRKALEGGFDAFTTTLLYSRYQQHDFIAERGEMLASVTGIAVEGSEYAQSLSFLYRDFRSDWQAGIDRSKEWVIYRQQYCGCIFSENERYAKAFKKSTEELEEDPYNLRTLDKD